MRGWLLRRVAAFFSHVRLLRCLRGDQKVAKGVRKLHLLKCLSECAFASLQSPVARRLSRFDSIVDCRSNDAGEICRRRQCRTACADRRCCGASRRTRRCEPWLNIFVSLARTFLCSHHMHRLQVRRRLGGVRVVGDGAVSVARRVDSRARGVRCATRHHTLAADTPFGSFDDCYAVSYRSVLFARFFCRRAPLSDLACTQTVPHVTHRC